MIGRPKLGCTSKKLFSAMSNLNYAMKAITISLLWACGTSGAWALPCPKIELQNQQIFSEINNYIFGERQKPGVDLTVLATCLEQWQASKPGTGLDVPYFRYLANYADVLSDAAKALEPGVDVLRLRTKEKQVRLKLVDYVEEKNEDIPEATSKKPGAERKLAETNLRALATVSAYLDDMKDFAGLSTRLAAIQTVNWQAMYEMGRAALSCNTWKPKDGFSPVPARRLPVLCGEECRSTIDASLDFFDKWHSAQTGKAPNNLAKLFQDIRKVAECK